MRRTDRLFEIIQVLRTAKAPISAAFIAETLEVSPRTIYRDMATLQSMRTPIEGEAGVGYILRKEYDLPPLNFDERELEAIVVGLSLLGRTGDTALQLAARRVLAKIDVTRADNPSLRVDNWGIPSSRQGDLDQIRQAIRDERKLRIHYQNAKDEESDRVILPIALTYYVEVVVLSAWCAMRKDFRHFRADRIRECRTTEQFFTGKGDELRKLMDMGEDW
jgi:predicted DNA-binding transcriptional regulator YafY